MPDSPRLVHETGDLKVDLAGRRVWVDGVEVPITGHAFEIVGVLAQAAGALVTKEELLRRVWPDAGVKDNTLQAHISAVRRALGARRDKLQTVARHGYRLVGEWTSHPNASRSRGEQPTEPRERNFNHNLPAAIFPLIGREDAEARVRELLTTRRVVTLAGPGGIGKSALALQVARDLFPDFDGDCWLIEFASLSDGALLPSAVVSVVGLRVGGEQISPEAVARAIGRKKLLLVLDSCEHLIDAAAGLVETVAAMCPGAYILATSREPLRIDGEHVYRVPPLTVPPLDLPAAQQVAAYSAARLFMAKAQAFDADFDARPERLPIIAAICRRLDGIPLAIEFAAARVATFGLQEVASRLDDRFRLLTAGQRTALPRHRTLRATLDWSYDLLPEFERRLLRRLAMFAGGFTLDAAAAVMNEASSSIAEGVASLVAKSLIVADLALPAGRWRLLETIRAYAFDGLVEHGEASQVARCHAQFFRDLAGPDASRVPAGGNSLAAYACELDNLRAALDWSFSAAGDTGIGVAITAAHCRLWLDLSLLIECRERIERALSHLAPDSKLDPQLQMQLHVTLGVTLIIMQGLPERARVALALGLDLAVRLDDREAQLRALWASWALHFNRGEHRVALTIAERFARAATGAASKDVEAVAPRIIGYTMQYMGRQREARASLEQAIALGHGSNSQRSGSWFVYNQQVLARASLARSIWLQGHVRQAAELANACVVETRALDDNLTLCFVLGLAIGPIALMTGELAAARRSVDELIEVSTMQSFSQYLDVGRSLEAMLAIEHGEFEAAAAQLRAILDRRGRTGWTIGHPEYLGALAKCHFALGRQADALAAVDQGLARAAQTGERWYVPELLRTQGELLASYGTGEDRSAAELSLHNAIDAAREQGALFWELRAAMSLARLQVQQGRRDAARRIVAPVYGRFTEGFETADLRQARTLLDTLAD